MNHPQLPFAMLRSSALRAAPTATAMPDTDLFSAMTSLKLYLAHLFAAATALSDSDEWRAFGGLLVGSLFSGLAGVGLLLLGGKAVARQIIVARMLVNVVFGLGLGALGLVVAQMKYGWHSGPLLTVSFSFVCGIIGVGLWRVFEPRFQRYLENRADALLPDNQVSRNKPNSDNQ